ncbi:aldose 1-epimerase family protein [Ruminococcus sp.]|uniref:aldose 1-epimerase family protein n=1 Tax=Ruminococcus sp. TaxID=41978 RepID=UPI0025FA8FD1|nr:aldose 1-epimerase family protein [Ruminococcus sp.]MBQ9542807.1 aldose 1-epimerase family protein [Ruminococcus sp.]
MLYSVNSGNIEFSADTFGAELHSIRFEGREYLWQCGDAWKRYAPVLFPFVCSPADRSYRADGKDYKMKANHGFARDMEFEFAGAQADSIEFILRDSEETLTQYPYNFELTVRYTALPNGVKVENIVKNTGEKTMYFYLGGHPAFNCPLAEGEKFEDYDIVYQQNEHIADPAGNVLAENGNTLAVTRSLFDNDAIMIDKPNSKAVTLKSRKSERAVTVKFPQSDCIAVWSPTGDDRASFVCLEPWTSVPVYADDEYPDIEKKPHAVRLEAGKVFSYAYEIEVR